VAQDLWLKETNIHPVCPQCSHTLNVRINLLTYEHKVVSEPKAGFGERMKLIEAYKRAKGYDRIPTWDAQHRARALKVAGQILQFFRKVDDPVGIACECIEDIAKRAHKEHWTWTLETIHKRAPDWLLEKQKEDDR